MLLSKMIAKLQGIQNNIGDVFMEILGEYHGNITYCRDFYVEKFDGILYTLCGIENIIECPGNCGWKGILVDCTSVGDRIYCVKCGALIEKFNSAEEKSFDLVE